MRKCRKMISVIMLMVMLVSLLPSGALAAEAPTGATNEVAAVEEPTEVEPATGETEETLPAETKTDGTENEGDNETTITEGTSEGASVSDGTEGTEVSAEGETSAEVAEEVEPTEVSAAGETSVEVAPAVEPVEKEAKAAGEPIDLSPYVVELQIRHRQKGSEVWEDYDPVNSPLINGDELDVSVSYSIPEGKLSKTNNQVDYTFPKQMYIAYDMLNVPTMNRADEEVGKLNIKTTTNGVVASILFNESFANGNSVEGGFTFNSYLYIPEPEEPQKVVFPGAGSGFEFTIAWPEEHSIKATKGSSALTFENGAYKTTYTIEVFSEKGTEDTVTISDSVSNSGSNFKYTYNNLVVRHKNAEGVSTVVPASSYNVSGTAPSWTISGLPALKKGERYLVTYDAKIEQIDKQFTYETHSNNKGTKIYNKVTATSGGDSSTTDHTLTINPELKKDYTVYDSRREYYTWTVLINQNSHDITGYTYTDVMSEKFLLNSKIIIKSTVSGRTDEINPYEAGLSNKFEYRFTVGSGGKVWNATELKGPFEITYRASAATVPGGTAVLNTGTLTGGGLIYKDEGRIVIGTPTMKTLKQREGAVYDDEDTSTLRMQWLMQSIQMPTSMTAGSSFTYVDTLGPLMKCVDADGNQTPHEDEIVEEVPVDTALHYTTCSQVANNLHSALRLVTPEGFYVFNLSGDLVDSNGNKSYCYLTESGMDGSYRKTTDVTYKLIGYDADGNSYDIAANANDTSHRLVKFEIIIIANKDIAIKNATLGSAKIFSYVEYGKNNYDIVNGGGLVRIHNTLTATQHADWTSDARHQWRLGVDREKSSKVVAKDGKIYIDYTAVVHYDLINLGRPVELIDQRGYLDEYSGGFGTYAGNATATIYADDAMKTVKVKSKTMADSGAFKVDSSEDASGKLVFKFDLSKVKIDSYCKRVKITYRVEVDEDPYWNDPLHNRKVYTNVITDEHGHSAEASTAVTLETDVLKKSGTQRDNGTVPEGQVTTYQGIIDYSIKINEGEDDLDPDSDTIYLTDTLDDDGAAAEFDHYSVKLYYADEKEVPENEWSYKYSPDDKTLTVTLKDKTAYLLNYSYTVKRDNVNGAAKTLKNKAELCGFFSELPIPIKEVSAESHADQRTLKFIKVDKDDYNIKLPGATFTLKRYDSENEQWEDKGSFTTGDDGSTSIDLQNGLVDTDVLYMLTETAAPKGYTNKDLDGEDITIYFVVKSKNESDEEAKEKVGFGSDYFPETSKYHIFDYYGGNYTIENIEVGDLSVKKIVENGSDSDNSKEFSFTVTLSDTSINGTYGQMTFKDGVAKFTLKNGETKKATGLPAKKDNEPVTYTVVETAATGYTVKKTGDTGKITGTAESKAVFTNTPDTTQLTVTKKWDDLENVDNTRPDSITVHLWANGKEEGAAVTLTKEKNYTYTWTGLKKNDSSGKPISYKVTEDKVPGYNDPVVGDPVPVKDAAGNVTGYTIEITNSLTPKTEVPVIKVWNDVNNVEKKRPTSIKVILKADGTQVGDAVELTENSKATIGGEEKSWAYIWTDLVKYAADGKTPITYTVEEDKTTIPSEYYSSKSEKDKKTGVWTITNTYIPKTNITVKKVWNDANNQDGVRPTSITVFLTKDGKKVDGTDIILDGTVDTLPNGSPNPELESVEWGHTWSDLDKYDSDGNLIAYGVDEDTNSMPKDYSKSVTPNGTEFTITNTYAPGKVKAQVTKNWDDANNQDGLRKSVDVQLMKNGQSMGNAYKATLTKENGWYKEWTGLDEKEGGVAIQYTVAEISKINGYTTTGPNAEYDAATKTWKISITNKHTPETTKINVVKVWDDNNNQDGKRPTSINVYLTKNGTKDESSKQTLTKTNNWTYTWDNLPVCENEGEKITYSVTEDVIPEYNSGKAAQPVKEKEESDPDTGIKTVFYSLTNTYSPKMTNAYIYKVWNDKNDQDGKRPEKLHVKLMKKVGDATTTVAEFDLKGPDWKAAFANLPVYENEGVPITYTWVEGEMPEGYSLESTTVEETTKGIITTITNKYDTEKTTAHVEKVWNDAGNMDKRRPTEITVKLVKDGTPVDGSEVTLDGEVDDIETSPWEYTWTGLDKYREQGTEILYTVVETSISEPAESGYEKKVTVDEDHTNGFKITVTNTHKERPVSISKVDITNSKEVAGATLQILDSNKKVVTAKDEEGNDFECTWTSTTEPKVIYGLTPGTVYTLHEEVQPDGYTIAADTTFTVDANGVVTSSGTVTNNVVLVEDAPTKVNVRKVDIANDKELPGATLQIIDSKNVVFKEWTSTEEDYVVTNLIAGEEYTLVETVAPLGFTVTSKTTFTVDNNNKVTSTGATTTLKDGTPVLLVKDTMTVVKISKTDITGDKELKGATLQILDENGNVVTVKDHDGNDVKCEWVSTDKPHVVEGLEINKTYTLREKTAPDGFTITTDATFSIDENNRITTEIPRNSAGVLLVKDKPTKVKVSKVDITGEKELQGATLQILDSEGKVVEIKDNDGNVVETCEWVSTKEPKDIVGLKTGVVYTLCETIAPDGYTIATEFQFTIAADGTVTCTGKTTTAEDGTTVLLVEDAPTKVYISKTDINSGDELPGATLQILDEEENVIVIKDNDGNPVETLEWVSGEEPKYIEGLPTGVNYILRETISPDGYTIASDTKFTIDEKGVVTSDGTTSVAEDGTTVLVVEDDLTTVQISKVDTESGKELEGAKLQIIDEEGKVVEEWTSTKEVHVVRGLVANKKYILRETVAPLGYTLTTDTTFSIDMHNVVTSTGPVNKDGVILVNDTMTEVEILKVDSKTGKGLAGAKLQVLDDNGAVCDEWKSTKDAHKIRGLYTGVKYTLHEVEAPKGYDKAKDITFTIDTAGKVSSDALDNGKIVMKDTPTPKKNKTGDEANGSLWALLLMMASGALGGTVWFKRKRRV